MKKYVLIFIAVCTIILSGCGETSDETYSRDLAKIFPSEVNTTAKYFGLAEYGHSVTLKNIKEESDLITYYIDGYIYDLRGEDDNKRQFQVKYIIDNMTIKEEIVNNDEFREEEVNDRIHSIIPNQIILKLPLEVNNSWKQKFTFKGKEYTANTVITEIKLTEDKSIQYSTKTTVNNIPGYFNNQYIEERVYEQNKGLISFSNTMEQSGTEPVQDFKFTYQQTSIDYSE